MSESFEIKKINPIKLSGLSNKVKVIGADYQVGDLKRSSSVSISLIDKDNVLESFPLSLKNPIKIEIGSLVFFGYPIKEKRSCSPSGDVVINVDFIDGSFILDKILVGLWGKHHQVLPKTIEISGNSIKSWKRGSFYGQDPLIIVGDFIDPCGDDEINVIVDPCDVCETSPFELIQEFEEDMRKIDCEKIRDLRILDVEYSFQDLMTAINDGWPSLRISSVPFSQGTSTYKKDYTGTLRDVLTNWCRDFGWTFYWEDGEIVFLDIRSGIDINLKGLDSNCNVLSINTSRSLEGTYSNNVLGYFGREGQERDYQCNYEFGKRVVCRALTLKDLLSPLQPMAKFASAYVGTSGGSFSEWATDKYDLLEFLCMCSMYSPRLREAIAWLNVYGIVSPEAAQERVETSKSVEGINGVSIEYRAYHDLKINDDIDLMKFSMPLSDLTIKKVFSKEINSGGFDILKNAIGGEAMQLIDSQEDEEDDYYFFIGSRNDEKFSTRYEWESSIGSDFLGKFFIRKYDSKIGNSPSVIAAGGDSAKYYEHGEIGLDFSKFFTVQNPESYIDELVNSTGETKDAFILVERDPMWLPNYGEGDYLESLIQICDELVPQEISSILSLDLNGQLSSSDLKNDHPDSENDENGGWVDTDKIFLVKRYKSSKNSGALSVSNLQTYDFHPKDTIKESYIEGYETPVKVGLRSLQAKKVSIEGIIFWMPPQSSVREQEASSESEHIPYAGGYYVFVNNNSSVETLLRVPKIEIVRKYSHSALDNTLVSNLVGASLSESIIDEYYYDETELGCFPKTTDLEKAIDDYVSPLRINQTEEMIGYDIELNGVPEENFKISDGFRSMSVRFYDGAPSTSLSFSNSFPIPEDPNLRLEFKKNPPLFHNEESRRRWRNVPDGFPREGGYPTL